MKRVLAVDQGTTATKAYTLDTGGRLRFCRSVAHPQIYPRPGWVEHDPRVLLDNVRRAIAAAPPVDAVGLDNQGETVVAWDGGTGEPVCNAIVWQDRRTADFTAKLKADGAEGLTLERAGLPLDPYFSASKLRWMLQNVPAAGRLLQQGRLRLGTSDSYLIHRLTGEYATDVTTASRTSLMNLATGDWDPDLCALFGVPLEALPPIRTTTGHFGVLRRGKREIPLTAAVVDQQAALLGHGCYAPGRVKATFGTGVFVLANVGSTVRSDPERGILSTVAWQLEGREPVYAVDAGVYNAGSAVDWLRRLGLFADFEEIDRFEAPSAVSRNLMFVPALSGLACPFWDRSAAGLWLGMSLETTARDLCQAVLEGIAFRTAQLLDALTPLTGRPSVLSVDGGLVNNAYFRRFLSDLTRCEISVPDTPDITALGTARLALVGAGFARDLGDLPAAGPPREVVRPRTDLSPLAPRFEEAVRRSRSWR